MTKIIFFGTPCFSSNVLDYLIESGIEVCAVVTRIDTPKKRSQKLLPPPVKIMLQEKYPDIPILQPIKTSEPEFQEKLKSFNADMFIFVAFGKIIGTKILNMPRLGCINLHTSLLPKYRGAAPIQRAIINGETESGVTIMHMVWEMDAGNIIKQEKVAITPDMNFGELESALCETGKKLLYDVIVNFESKDNTGEVQDEQLVTFAPKIEVDDGYMNWHKNIDELYNTFRGTTPAPGAWCIVEIKGEEKRLKIKECFKENFEHNRAAGTILEYNKNGVSISCNGGAIRITKLQLEGKKPMLSSDFINGVKLSELNIKTL